MNSFVEVGRREPRERTGRQSTKVRQQPRGPCPGPRASFSAQSGVGAQSITGPDTAAGPTRGSAISLRPRRKRRGPCDLGLSLPVPLLLVFLRITRFHLDPAPRPSPPASPPVAPLRAPRAPYWPRRQHPSRPPRRLEPTPPQWGKRVSSVTPDLARSSPYRFRHHLTSGPRAGGSISREPAPRQPTHYTPSDWPTGPQPHIPIGWVPVFP